MKGCDPLEDDACVELDLAGRRVVIEHAWVGSQGADVPLIVFLHEGLGSVSMWRDWPHRLCSAVGARGLVYSRPGYGRSTLRAVDERWGVDFMHRQALEVLPRLFDVLGLDAPQVRPWLLGHSDGASIALIHAAHYPDRIGGLIVAAPHVFVEDIAIQSIEHARDTYLTADLRERLSRHHVEPDSAFWGWNDTWLDPAFRHWSIEALLPKIVCPVLAVQGYEDEYGTMTQIDRIGQEVPRAELLKLRACGHSAHRDQPDALIRAVSAFMQRHGTRAQPG